MWCHDTQVITSCKYKLVFSLPKQFKINNHMFICYLPDITLLFDLHLPIIGLLHL